MTSTPATTQDPERDEPPFGPALVEEMLRQLDKTVRARQLYLANNPAYRQALDKLRATFAPLWGNADSLSLQVTDTSFKWCGLVVHDQPTKASDSLPWLFYKDGLREVTLTPGFEGDELEQLIDIIPKVRRAQPDEDDLITMLWEHEFANLSYRHVEIGHDGVAMMTASPDPGRYPPGSPSAAAAVGDSRQASADARAEMASDASARPGVVSMDEFDSTLYFLDQKEIEYIKREIENEYRSDLRRSVVNALLDIFELHSDDRVRTEVLQLLDEMVLQLLAAAQFQTVAYLLSEISRAVDNAHDLNDLHRNHIRAVPHRLSEAATLSQVLQHLDQVTELPAQEALNALFAELQPVALQTIFEALDTTRNPKIKALLEEAAGRLAASHTSELVRLISQPSAVVALQAIRRAAAMKASAAVTPLTKVLAEGERELRVAAVAALVEIGSAGAMQSLEKALGDGDREIRITAVRAIGGRGQRSALPRVDSIVKSKELRAADMTERMAFFEAYGQLCGDGGVPFLDGLLNGKSGLLGRKEDREIRACAASALGYVKTSRAEESLKKGLDEKDLLVRNAVNRALRRGAA
jgi:HEAT repeat protein